MKYVTIITENYFINKDYHYVKRHLYVFMALQNALRVMNSDVALFQYLL